jgi:hypothetical protein
VCLDDSGQRRVLVAARDEQRPIAQVRETAAEDVEARVHPHVRLGPGLRVPDGGPGERVVLEGLRGPVTDRVICQHLAVGQQRHVHANDRPVDQRSPAPHLVLVPRHRRFGRLGVRRGGRNRRLLERRLLGASVTDRVFRLVPADRFDRVTERACWTSDA